MLPLLEVFIDPTVIFSAVCLLTPLWQARATLTAEAVAEYFMEPSTLGALLLLPTAWLVGQLLRYRKMRWLRAQRKSRQSHGTSTEAKVDEDALMRPLTFGERRRARWYLLNGVIIHMLMDGCVGVFKTNRLFASNYAKLDRRYGEVIGQYNGSAVHVVSLMELFVKGPICIMLYICFYIRSPMRDVLEFFTCVTQAYGTIVYLGQEAISGAPNLDVDRELSFSMHHLVYFWFAIFFGCTLYLFVPIILGWASFRRLTQHTRCFIEYRADAYVKS